MSVGGASGTECPVYQLGVSAYYHDSAAALLRNGEIVAAAQEERFTRRKHDPSFPANAVRFCLGHAGITLADVASVAFYDKPFLKFERLLETYYAFAPRGLRSFLASMPVWVREKLLLKKLLRDELNAIEKLPRNCIRLLFPEHHLSHAASAFFPSPYQDAAILTIDGVGEWSTASICHGTGNSLRILKELRFPHSLGLLYSAFTQYLGFRVNSGEYKLMGLAPYGNPGSPAVARYKTLITEQLVDIRDDGSLWLDQSYFEYATGLSMVCSNAWEKLFGFSPRDPDAELRQEHCDLALAIQQVTEDVVCRMAREARMLTGSPNLCLAGGVALNCVANGKLLKSGIFERIWIQPAAGDAGGALGAALAAWHIGGDRPRTADGISDAMSGAYLGPEYGDEEATAALHQFGPVFRVAETFDEVCRETARNLAEGCVIGWFQGRMEWGPRALGNRSIIADPRNPEMQKKLNLKIKFREGFRPFAPSVLAEIAADYFDIDVPSPYMLLVADVRETRRVSLPDDFHTLSPREKLRQPRSDIPSVTHIDYSARIQTVHRETNPSYWQLIDTFRQETGYGVIVNTSFNVRGEPIVMTPEDAYRCFMRTGMDFLVIGKLMFDKRQQPAWQERDDWREEFVPD